ncbi:hypothetical protein HY358_02465 [Candidatus Roizmanbacteria bacterium]|nr:hypothetical protein [Candidatus Roizmanbacteria bacterium]
MNTGVYRTYCAARRIATLFLEEVAPPQWVEDRTSFEPIGTQGQMGKGLVLEVYRDIPESLWTPWGLWWFIGNAESPTGWSEERKKFFAHLAVGPYEPASERPLGTLYAVLRVENEVLPQPVERQRSEYLSYHELAVEWQRLTRRYERALNRRSA